LLWYDSFKTKNSTLFKNKNDPLKSNFRNLKNKPNFYIKFYIIPLGWDMLVLRNKSKKYFYIILYSSTYYLKIPLYAMSNFFPFDSVTNQFFINNLFINNFIQTYYSLLRSFYKVLLKPSFSKLTFKGKGYYIFKNHRNTITPQFGYSHRLYLYAFYTHVIFLSKTSLIVFGFNPKHVKALSKSVFMWRPVNIFTGRGVRFSKQIIYKKSGKVSTYR
jgi:hypothetical protein